MNAQALFTQDGKSTSVWFCGQCHHVSKNEELAEKCCSPVLCDCCGKPVNEPYRTRCEACREAKNKAQEQDRFERAQKVPEEAHQGWVYSEGRGSNEGYFPSVEEVRDWLASSADENEKQITYVWDCTPLHFVQIDMDDIMDRFDDEAWEGFGESDLEGVPELKKALEAFVEANAAVCSYRPNYQKAVILGSY